jgi:hypothetical protein
VVLFFFCLTKGWGCRKGGCIWYLDFTPELGPDILSHETIAHQKDDLAGKLSPESRRQLFCGVGSREEVPYICLDEDERVSDGAEVTSLQVSNDPARLGHRKHHIN